MTEYTKSKRLFIALFPDKNTQARLREIQQKLETLYQEAPIRWTHDEQFHVTLRFLGNTAHDKITTLVDHLQLAITQLPSFSLSINQITGFPHPHNPHVIAAECDAHDGLTHLVQNIEKALVGLGFSPAKYPFRPHMTLGRIKQKPLSFTPIDLSDAPFTFDVNKCFLMSSVLEAQGAHYYPIETFRFSTV